MTSRTLAHPLLATSLALCLLAACQPAPTTPPPAPSAAPTEEPVRAASTPAPSAVPSVATSAVGGAAGVLDKPFAGADVKVFRLGQKESLAVGKTDDTGHFIVDLGTTPVGMPVRVVATKGNQVLASIVAAGAGNIVAQGAGNIVAQGGGNIVAQGGGNIVAQGGGNIVAQGGGNIVAQGGGNIVAQGGGNIVAQGGGNHRVLATDEKPKEGEVLNPPGLTRLNLATTTAVAILQTRLEAYGQVSDNGSRGDGESMLDALRGLATELYAHETNIVAKVGVENLLTALNEAGVGAVTKQTGDALLAVASGLAEKIETFVAAIDKTINKTSEETGKKPDASTVGELKLGSESLGTLEQHVNETNQGAVVPAPNGNPSGGSGGAGSNGATIEVNNTTASGVTVSGNFSTSSLTVANPGLNVSLTTGTAYSAFFTSPNVSLARSAHATVLVGSRLYVIGGKDGAGNEVNTIMTATINSSNVVSAFTSSGFTLPVVLSGASVAYDSQGGKLYVIGGESGGATVNTVTTLDLDAANNITAVSSSALLTNPTDQRSHGTCVVDAANNAAFVVGGFDGNGTLTRTVLKVSFGGAIGTLATALPAGRLDPAAVAMSDGTVILTGGKSAAGAQATIFTSALGTMGAWATSTKTLAQARYGHQAVVYNNDVLVFGGHGSSSTLSTAEGGNLTNGFQLLAPGMGSGREGFTATVFSTTRLLLLGGVNGSSTLSSGSQSLLSN